MYFSKIIGTGKALPTKSVSNDEFLKILNWDQIDSNWIKQRTGVENRFWVENGQLGSDLAYDACRMALENSNLTSDAIEAIVYIQLTPEMEFPSGAFVLQGRFDSNIPVFDLRAQCGGYIYGLQLADAFIKSGTYKTVMVVASEVHSHFIDKEYNNISKNVSILFGDGAGATILTRDNEPGILKIECKADGSKIDYLSCQKNYFRGQGESIKVDGSVRYQNGLDQIYPYPFMNGPEIFKNATMRFEDLNKRLPEEVGLKWDQEIDYYLFHQANLRIIEFVGKNLNLPKEKVPTNVQRYGNLSGATLPILLHEQYEGNKFKKDDKIILSAFGAGLVWGGVVVKI